MSPRPTTTITAEQIEAAKLLRQIGQRHKEPMVKQRLAQLLTSLGIECFPEYPIGNRRADFYLPRRRTFIEAKAPGGVEFPNRPQSREIPETPKEQLEHYLFSERDRDLGMLEIKDEPDRDWVGILTDGLVWHAWSYAHERDAQGREKRVNWSPTSDEELVIQLKKLLSGDLIGKPWIPEDPLRIFEEDLRELEIIEGDMSASPRQRTDVETKLELWLDMLRTADMAPSSASHRTRLFIRHSMLITIARGVIHTLAQPRKDPNPDMIMGDGFNAWILESYCGRRWGKRILDKVHSYDWRRKPGDILRPIYEGLIDKEDRKSFGEYYTPDWLAELVVETVLDEQWCNEAATQSLAVEQTGESLTGVGVLDPACGSGTFLYHAVKRVLQCEVMQDESLAPGTRAAATARLVCGLDIHPVAVEIARTTILRALPTTPPESLASIRVYQGDSLLAEPDAAVCNGGQGTLFSHTNQTLRFRTPRGREMHVPRSFWEHRLFPTNLQRLVRSARDADPLPRDLTASVPKTDREALAECHSSLTEIIGEEGNSIWAWYILNISAPVRLSEQKVNRIVSNPPWVTVGEIQTPVRKANLESMAQQLKLWDGGRQAPNTDIAQLFVRRGREEFLANPDSDAAGWIVKKAALHGGNWKKFREWHEAAKQQSIDLEDVQPFGGGDARRCCMLLDHCELSEDGTAGETRLELRKRDRRNKLRPDMTLDEAKERCNIRTARERTPQGASPYSETGFRRGAEIGPRVLVGAARVRLDPNNAKTRIVTTERSTDRNWKSIVPVEGTVDADWIETVLTSGELLPFRIRLPGKQAIIPRDQHGDLHPKPEKMSRFWSELENIYREHRGRGKSNPETLIECINFSRKLAVQLARSPDARRRTVVYPKSGDLMRASRMDGQMRVFADTLYYGRFRSEAEAAYLVAILNSSVLTKAFADTRTSGRDFHLNPFRKVPIPKFDRRNKLHQKLARLTRRAESVVEQWMKSPEFPKHLQQVRLSSRIRELLRDHGIMDKIDESVKELLPEQTSS